MPQNEAGLLNHENQQKKISVANPGCLQYSGSRNPISKIRSGVFILDPDPGVKKHWIRDPQHLKK
jgi:hypothetical protein